MILQRHERGDYMITEKGFKALRGVSELYSDLVSDSLKTEARMVIQSIDI
jgi:predicted transcriptional regulator